MRTTCFTRNWVSSLIGLYRNGNTASFEAVFDVVERFQIEGDPEAREAATIGLLEGIQNVGGNSGIDPEQFVKYLGPESLKWWDQLNKFWAGETRYVGETIDDES